MSSYRQIFKSTAVIGGAQGITILVGIIRVKVLAILLGPAGMGLVGLYLTATDLIKTVTGMGIGSSSVRDIAEASAAGQSEKIGFIITAVRRCALVSGVVGMVLVLILCSPLSQLSFGDREHVKGMALMSLALLFGGLAAGQLALLQGLRKIRDLAAAKVLGAVFGAVASVLLVYWLREDGVAPYLVAVAGFGLLTSWWYSRRIEVETVHMPLRETWQHARGFLRLGSAFMIGALLVAAGAYVSRVLIKRELGMDAVGLYQATWTLSALYVGLVLEAMGMDYYPRLTAVADDNAAVNRLVNEQTEMGLLIAIPGVLATIALAPLVLHVFYSGEFVTASGIIRWQIIGIALRVASWPLGYVQMAKGKGKVFVLTEFAAFALTVVLMFGCIRTWGLNGIGMAFCFVYVGYTLIMVMVCRALSGFSWTSNVWKILAFSGAAVIVTFLSASCLSPPLGMAINLLITLLVTAWCVQGLQSRLGFSVKDLFTGRS